MVLVTRTIPAGRGQAPPCGFTLFLVDVEQALAEGTLSYRPIPKMGTNTVASNMVFLDEVRVPADDVLGEVDQGFAVLWDMLNPERILAAAGARRRAPRLRCGGRRLREGARACSAGRSAPTRPSRSRSPRSRPRSSWPG